MEADEDVFVYVWSCSMCVCVLYRQSNPIESNRCYKEFKWIKMDKDINDLNDERTEKKKKRILQKRKIYFLAILCKLLFSLLSLPFLCLWIWKFSISVLFVTYRDVTERVLHLWNHRLSGVTLRVNSIYWWNV